MFGTIRWVLLVQFMSILTLCRSTSAGGRRLQVALICENGYAADGSCFSKDGVYLASRGVTLEFSQSSGWTGEFVLEGLTALIEIPGYDAGKCVYEILKSIERGLEDCSCAAACSIMAGIKLKTAGVSDKVLKFFTGGGCAVCCQQLYAKGVQFAKSQDDGGGVDDGGGGFAGCFPAKSTVFMADGSIRSIADVSIGEKVLSVVGGEVVPSTVYGFAHYLPQKHSQNVVIETTNGNTITATPDHYIYIANGFGGSWQGRTAVPAGRVEIGHAVWVWDESINRLILSNITDVRLSVERGLINPFTLSGTILVDGVAASVYNDLMGEENRMHHFTAFIRWMYKLAPSAMEAIHNSRLEKSCSQLIISLLELSKNEGMLGMMARGIVAVPSYLFPEPQARVHSNM